MKNVENQHWLFKIIAIMVSAIIASAIVASMLFVFVNKAQAYQIESFCAGGDFSAAGFESVNATRENGYCATFLQELKAKGDDKSFNENLLKFSKENADSQVIDTAAPRAKEIK